MDLERYAPHVITLDGRHYGTRHEIAAALGPDVTADMVRNWQRRGDLAAVKVGRTAYYDLAEVADVERAKRLATRGRPRRVDEQPPLAA